MKQKFQKNRAFYAAIAMIVISAIVLTTASFAWFTLGKSVGVKEMDLKVTSKQGLLISGNADDADGTWTDFLDRVDLDGSAETPSAWATYNKDNQYFPEVISPTSTDFQFTKGDLPKLLSGAIKAGKERWAMQAEDITSADGKSFADGKEATYFAFDLFIKYIGEGTSVTVSVGDSKIKVKEENPDVEEVNAAIEKAMRLGFVNLGTTEAGSETTYENNEAIIYVPPIDGTTPYEEAKSVLPVIGAGKSADLDPEEYTVPSGKAGTLTLGSYASGAVATSSSDATLTLEPGINHIRAYIWMEGQDANCTDALQSQRVTAMLDFAIA